MAVRIPSRGLECAEPHPGPNAESASQGELFEWAAGQMQYKWERLKAIFALTDRFVLETQLEPTAQCRFLRRPVAPAPAYAWVRPPPPPPRNWGDVWV
jgi:hypothetical protein